jgi:hypothetical protein
MFQSLIISTPAAVLFLVTFLLQQLSTGIVTGVIRDTSGKPLFDVRVAAMAPPETAAGANVLLAISRTDPEGRYRLEVTPGKVFIVAGRIDMPTYYPASTDLAAATGIQVRSGYTTEGIDIRMSAESLVVPATSDRVLVVSLRNSTIRASNTPNRPTNLLDYLTGYFATQSPVLVFEFVGLNGRSANFKTAMGAFSYACADCSFFIRNGGVGTQTSDPGMLFKVSANGLSIDYTCFASRCEIAQLVSGFITLASLGRNQSGGIQPTDQVAFAIFP